MPKHVKEAYRLLNKSIIRVDQPDIHLDDDEANDEMEIDDPGAEGDNAVSEPVSTLLIVDMSQSFAFCFDCLKYAKPIKSY